MVRMPALIAFSVENEPPMINKPSEKGRADSNDVNLIFVRDFIYGGNELLVEPEQVVHPSIDLFNLWKD